MNEHATPPSVEASPRRRVGSGRLGRPWLVLVGAVLVIVIAVAAGLLLFGGNRSDGDASPTGRYAAVEDLCQTFDEALLEDLTGGAPSRPLPDVTMPRTLTPAEGETALGCGLRFPGSGSSNYFFTVAVLIARDGRGAVAACDPQVQSYLEHGYDLSESVDGDWEQAMVPRQRSEVEISERSSLLVRDDNLCMHLDFSVADDRDMAVAVLVSLAEQITDALRR